MLSLAAHLGGQPQLFFLIDYIVSFLRECSRLILLMKNVFSDWEWFGNEAAKTLELDYSLSNFLALPIRSFNNKSFLYIPKSQETTAFTTNAL